MSTIDFQALASSSLMTLKTVNGALNTRAAGKGQEQSAFSRALERCSRSNRSETGETHSASSENVGRGIRNQEQNTSATDAAEASVQQSEVAAGMEASNQGTEAGQLEVKDESGTVKESSEENAAQSDGGSTDDVAEALENVATEIQELIAGLQSMAAQATSETGSEDSTLESVPGNLLTGLDDLLGDVQDLEEAILKLSQALEAETNGNATATGAESSTEAAANETESAEPDISKLMVMLNGNKMMIKAKISDGEEGHGKTKAHVEGSQGKGNESLHLMIKTTGRSNSSANEEYGNSEGGSEEAAGQSADSATVKKIMSIENNKLNMFKLHAVDKGDAAAENQPADTAAPQAVADENPAAGGLLQAMDDADLVLNGKEASKSVDPKQLIDQIVKKFELLTKPESSELKIQLKPDFLGKMTIKLSMEDGVLSAKFVTDNHQVKNLLESNLAMFKQQLEAAGIKVEKAEVSVQLGGGTDYNSMSGGQQNQWQFSDQGQTSQASTSGVYQDGYSGYSSEELEAAAANPLYDDVSGDSSVSYIV